MCDWDIQLIDWMPICSSFRSVLLQRHVLAVLASQVSLCVQMPSVIKAPVIMVALVRCRILAHVLLVGLIATVPPPCVHRHVGMVVDVLDRMLVGVQLNGRELIVVFPYVHKPAKMGGYVSPLTHVNVPHNTPTTTVRYPRVNKGFLPGMSKDGPPQKSITFIPAACCIFPHTKHAKLPNGVMQPTNLNVNNSR